MATTIVTKHGLGVPLDSDLVKGELAVDLQDRKIYSKNESGVVVEISPASDGSDGLPYITEAPDDAKQYVRESKAWAEVNVPDISGLVEEAPDDGKQYVRESEAWAEVDIPESGPSVQIGETFDGTPQAGDQWMEVPASGDATMWIYDGSNWLQQPGSKDGADGADGANGSDGLWTDNGGGSISYDGAVTVTGGLVASKSGAGLDTLAIGSDAGLTNQQDYAVAVGRRAGETDQQTYATAVGTRAGFDSQGAGSVSVGAYAGQTAQGEYSAAFGYNAGKESQGTGSVSLGTQAGETDQ